MDLAEEGKESQIQIDKKHLSRKIPRLDMILPEKEKEELIAYMRNRVNIVHILFPIQFFNLKKNNTDESFSKIKIECRKIFFFMTFYDYE